VDEQNPYKKRRKSQGDTGPILARLPTHYFQSAGDMERELYKYEACVALMPNSQPLGFEFHAAIVYKDGDNKVYSVGLTQHHGLLKDTKENKEALDKRLKEDKEEL
jgi:hypothetical protein